MARITVLCVLLVVTLVQQQTLASRRVINAGGEFRLDCSISTPVDAGRYIQFFINKTEVKVFNSSTSFQFFKLVSNGTTIVPTIANYTDRYMVEEYRTGQYRLIITNVTESDSGRYDCRYVERNRVIRWMGSTQLLVPGPFDGIFWTANYSSTPKYPLGTNYSTLFWDVIRAGPHKIPDGATALTDRAWYGPNIACVMVVSNIEPAVNITIGRFGEPGSVDITDQFETRSSISITHGYLGRTYRHTVIFSKKSKFTKTSLRDVYCRASFFGATYEKSVNIQVTSQPKNKACVPQDVAARVGSKNVNLTCLIEAHPEPYVEWTLPSGVQINALSNNPNYTVTNEARFEGLFTTLTISEITEGINDFGRIAINATNTEGSGEYYLDFKEALVNGGGEFRLRCSISRSGDPGRYVIQFFIEKTEVKIFNSRSYSDTLQLVSNGTTIVPTIANYTDRYMVEEYETGRYMLTITNVTESDSAWYGCRNFDVEQNNATGWMGPTELLVPGPFDGIFWTANYSKLSVDIARQHEVPDGGTVLTDNVWHGPNIACAVLVSNVEPAVNITIGRFGDPGSVDITDQFETRIASSVTIDNVGTVYRETVFFVKKSKFTKTSLRDVYCRASLFSTTYEKSVNIQVTSKPQNKACVPQDVYALVGSKNVNLTCLIEAHPEPYVEWTLPSGVQINALSDNLKYTVTNEARFEGLFTTLTISEITEGISDFGHIAINATNPEGSGEHYLNFIKGAAGITRSSAALITMTTCLMLWILK